MILIDELVCVCPCMFLPRSLELGFARSCVRMVGFYQAWVTHPLSLEHL